ncbi:hypothetical protein TcYC6_0004280 [Trypanosoma cruzi]|nr:hypothetical protein TcYC6_0004280 [Trypanosoma cruzi]
MYSVIQPAASATEMHVSGQSRNIKEIDLAAVFLTRQDREILALITSFDLSHNNIEQLHQLDALTALTRLNVSYNKSLESVFSLSQSRNWICPTTVYRRLRVSARCRTCVI